jgi:methyl-accepting chemotaxis protein
VLSQVGGRVYQTTQSGRNAVLRTVEGMGHINSDVHLSATKVQQLAEHSQEISDIVKIISGIAHQTNRLALDASIQAALAGENGKAFRAVADDIRRSAEVAKTQTNKIERIVKQLLEDIESVTLSIQDTETEAATGAQLSREAGAAFEAIVSAIEYQSREIEMINQAAQQQLQTSSSVAQVMRGVSSSTLQSSQSIREEAKRMERVAQLAEQLLVSAEVFKLRDDQDIFAQTNHGHVVEQQAFSQRSF